jgi:hypothetical protein
MCGCSRIQESETITIDVFKDGVTFLRNADTGKCYEVRVTRVDCDDLPESLIVDVEGDAK